MLTLYKNIKARRLDLKMSQDRLAELTGYKDRSSIAKIEKGDVDLAESKIREFAKALKTTPQELMGWDDIGTNIFTDDGISSPEDSMESPKTKKRASKRLDKALNMTGISAADLARTSEVSKSSISQYLSGSHIPSEENATKMGNILNVNPLWLMGFNTPMKTNSTAEQDERLATIIDYYQLLNDTGRDTAVARMRELTQIHDYVSQPDAYQVHADAIRQVNAIEESRNKHHRKTIS